MEGITLAEFVPIFRSGLIIGMLFAISAGVGGMLIHFVSKIFKIAGGA